jgi:hypothetical protein
VTGQTIVVRLNSGESVQVGDLTEVLATGIVSKVEAEIIDITSFENADQTQTALGEKRATILLNISGATIRFRR